MGFGLVGGTVKAKDIENGYPPQTGCVVQPSLLKVQRYCDCLLTSYSKPLTGGDLCAAIARDTAGQLRWYNCGHRIALDIARGLYFLHSHEVCHEAVRGTT